MILVMAIHANTFLPNFNDSTVVSSSLSLAFLWHILEGLSVVCVNAFILISGWFGIKFKGIRLAELIFTIYFLSILTTLVFPSTNGFNKDLLDILLLKQNCFFPYYILLYILSPALNAFTDKASRRQFTILLILYFSAQTVFSYIDYYPCYADGFSPMPYIGIYLLGRYLRVHGRRLTELPASIYICVYLGMSILLAAGSVFLILHFGTGGRMYNYTNPLVIISSVFFFLFFTRIKLESKFINWLGISSISAILIHYSPGFYQPVFGNTIQLLFQKAPYFYPITAFAFFFFILLASCTIDKLRILVWKSFSTLFQSLSPSNKNGLQ